MKPVMFAGFLSLWQVKQSAAGGGGMSFTRVMSLFTRTSWQLRQLTDPFAWADFALVLSAWHVMHLAESAFGSSAGCLAASNCGTAIPMRRVHSRIVFTTAIPSVGTDAGSTTFRNRPTIIKLRSEFRRGPMLRPSRECRSGNDLPGTAGAW